MLRERKQLKLRKGGGGAGRPGLEFQHRIVCLRAGGGLLIVITTIERKTIFFIEMWTAVFRINGRG